MNKLTLSKEEFKSKAIELIKYHAEDYGLTSVDLNKKIFNVRKPLPKKYINVLDKLVDGMVLVKKVEFVGNFSKRYMFVMREQFIKNLAKKNDKLIKEWNDICKLYKTEQIDFKTGVLKILKSYYDSSPDYLYTYIIREHICSILGVTNPLAKKYKNEIIELREDGLLRSQRYSEIRDRVFEYSYNPTAIFYEYPSIASEQTEDYFKLRDDNDNLKRKVDELKDELESFREQHFREKYIQETEQKKLRKKIRHMEIEEKSCDNCRNSSWCQRPGVYICPDWE
ncbi:MAG: hypothetical protein ACOC3V_05615 [bacterium]